MKTTLRNIIDKLAKIGYSRLIFYTFLFFLPFGTRKAFFGSQSLFFGYHIFYNTYFLYLTDLIFVCLLLAWLIEAMKARMFHVKLSETIFKDRIYLSLAIFWLISAVSILFSHETWLGLYGLARITQGILVFSYIREKIDATPHNELASSTTGVSPARQRYASGVAGGREIRRIATIIIASLSLVSLLAIFQYIFQSSFGLQIFGEEFLRRGMWGVAEFVSRETFNPWLYHFLPYLRQNSEISLVIRGYGTLPHPNVLSGLLFTGLMLNIWLIYSKAKVFSRENTPSSSPPNLGGARRGILIFSLILISTGLIVTFSRVTWLVTGLALLVWIMYIFVKIRKPHVLAMKTGRLDTSNAIYKPGRVALIAISLLLALALNIFLFKQPIISRIFDKGGSTGDYFTQESITERKTFNSISREMIQKNPLLGVGLKNYVAEMDQYNRGDRLLPQLHQPVHNIYLLIASESGILALILFLVVIYNIVRQSFIATTVGTSAGKATLLNFTLLTILIGFLIIGLFDHYLLTIQQGSLMFWIMLGLLAGLSNKKTAEADSKFANF